MSRVAAIDAGPVTHGIVVRSTLVVRQRIDPSCVVAMDALRSTLSSVSASDDSPKVTQTLTLNASRAAKRKRAEVNLNQFRYEGSSCSGDDDNDDDNENGDQGKDGVVEPTVCTAAAAAAPATPTKKRPRQRVFVGHGGAGRVRAGSRTSSPAADDVSVHTRKAIWRSVHGQARHAVCFTCQFDEVGWDTFGFDLAHIVARACGGNNSASWNRMVSCSTCNQKVKNGLNFLDFVAAHYPHRVVPVALNLWRRFRDAEPHVAEKYFAAHGLEAFVRTVYGRGGLAAAPLEKYLRRLLPDYDDGKRVGRINNEQVYAIVRHYDETFSAKATLTRALVDKTRDIAALTRVVGRLQAECAEGKAQLRVLRGELARLEQSELLLPPADDDDDNDGKGG